VSGKILSLGTAFLLCLVQARADTLRGKLVQTSGKPPAIETVDHKLVPIDADPQTLDVLNDLRLELHGEYKKPETFTVGSFYTTQSVFVLKDGKKFTISYWCPICSIRSYTPGKCVCCQRETHLDLQPAS
jgi:hypothetical protein